MFVQDDRMLTSYRAKEEGGLNYRAMQMDAEQKIARRRYMRRILRNMTRFCNAPNAVLDQMLVFRIDEGYIIQDEIGRDFFLPGAMAWGTILDDTPVQQTLPFLSNGEGNKEKGPYPAATE